MDWMNEPKNMELLREYWFGQKNHKSFLARMARRLLMRFL